VFPIFLNLSGKLAVVVGCGTVGARKLAALVEAGARVRVIDPRALACEHVAEPYRAEHLSGAALVFACGPPEVNARVVADARAAGIWVNSASAPAEGDFALPAVVRRGEFALAVGTGGAAPALARRVREKLETEYDAAFGEWVRVLAEVREEVLAREPDAQRRRELLDGFAAWEWLSRVRAEGAVAVKAAMLACV
jgi:precorrin-2 dehydrogenase / sirohydrochlorin ferrochelatase